MSIAYIGIGSNLGERRENIDRAIEKLKSKNNIEIEAISTIIETEAVGQDAGGKFLNGCIKINTTLYPDELLDSLKSIEREMGRNRDISFKKPTAQEQLKMLEDTDADINEMARKRPVENKKDKKSWGPRNIDLDILFYDDIIMKGYNLIIPHESLHKRLFALVPLLEIAPDLTHPALKKSISELIEDLKADNQDRVVIDQSSSSVEVNDENHQNS